MATAFARRHFPKRHFTQGAFGPWVVLRQFATEFGDKTPFYVLVTTNGNSVIVSDSYRAANLLLAANSAEALEVAGEARFRMQTTMAIAADATDDAIVARKTQRVQVTLNDNMVLVGGSA